MITFSIAKLPPVFTAIAIAASFSLPAQAATHQPVEITPTAATDTAMNNPSEKLNQLFEAYWQDQLGLNPALALSQGDTRYQSKFDDSLEDSWRKEMLHSLHHFDTALAKYNHSDMLTRLSPQDRVSFDMLHYQIKQQLSFYGTGVFETWRMLPIEQFMGQHSAYAMDAAGAGNYPFKTVADYDNALARADSFARWVDDAIMRMKEGMAKGVVLPRIVVERVIPQLENYQGLKPERTELWHPITDMPKSFSRADRERLTKAFAKKIATVIIPAYQRLHDFMKNDYLPHARSSDGLRAIPGGVALYTYDVAHHTTTNMTPAEIHALGLKEVARIMAEFEKVRQKVGFKGNLQAFFRHVSKEPALHFQNRADVIPAYQAARARIFKKLPQLFDTMPKAKFEIRAMPDSSKHYQGNGYYQQAAADGSRPGILWINTYAPGIKDKFIVMTTSLHEGLPGHHMQTSLGQEATGLPSFRRFDFTNAYGEGWALYCESLGKRMGLYDNIWQYFGHLNNEILRANRLVVDTGIHAMGWSRDQGIKWMMDHSSFNHDQAAAEVERYIAYPGQALSYKIGQLKIQALRDRAQAALGKRFDIRKFHDQILLGGSMPIAILDQKITRWIANSRQKHM